MMNGSSYLRAGEATAVCFSYLFSCYVDENFFDGL